jgi:hypothetical protein
MTWLHKIEALVSAGFTVEIGRVMDEKGQSSQRVRCCISNPVEQNKSEVYSVDWGNTANEAFRKAEKKLARGIASWTASRGQK